MLAVSPVLFLRTWEQHREGPSAGLSARRKEEKTRWFFRGVRASRLFEWGVKTSGLVTWSLIRGPWLLQRALQLILRRAIARDKTVGRLGEVGKTGIPILGHVFARILFFGLRLWVV